MTTSKRKHHPPQSGSKRSQRRQRAIDRAAYFDDKDALALGAPVLTFAAARAVVLRAAFGRESDGSLPDEGLLWDRVNAAIQRHVSKRVQAEYSQQLRDTVDLHVNTALGLQQARALMREIRVRRDRCKGLPAPVQNPYIGLMCKRLRETLSHIGRPIPAEFRER